ncbi:TraX family protein [Oribacterium sp. P6A1]|uniref:TraX family protein n=1 Tax=Oribacterium sp. P6A1 TaxID=1410612 RepID=UPI00055B76CE|nr:TraX family protein [Oribacterium sp. P6A1]
MNKTTIKLLALVTMLLDHTALIILTPGIEGKTRILETLHLSLSTAVLLNRIFLSVGSMAGSIMIYSVIEGYHYTRDTKKYLLRFMAFGVVSQIPFLMLHIRFLNMLITLALCLMTVHVRYHVTDMGRRGMLYLLLIAANLHTDWNLRAVPFTLILMQAFHPEPRPVCLSIDKKQLKFAWLKCVVLYMVVDFFSLESITNVFTGCIGVVLAALVTVYFYNGKQGKQGIYMKYGFYGFYPLHLIALIMLSGVKPG